MTRLKILIDRVLINTRSAICTVTENKYEYFISSVNLDANISNHVANLILSCLVACHGLILLKQEEETRRIGSRPRGLETGRERRSPYYPVL